MSLFYFSAESTDNISCSLGTSDPLPQCPDFSNSHGIALAEDNLHRFLSVIKKDSTLMRRYPEYDGSFNSDTQRCSNCFTREYSAASTLGQAVFMALVPKIGIGSYSPFTALRP